MSYFVVISEKCVASAKKYNLISQFNELKDEIEPKQYIGFLQHFPNFFLKKRFERQQRLIAQERKIELKGEEYTAILFYDIYIRDDKQYKEFLKSPREYAEKHFIHLFSDDKVCQCCPANR